jgi:hypothetical protein
MYKVYGNGWNHHRKGKWIFFKDFENLDEVKEYILSFGFRYKGTDKNGVVYYGDAWWNYLAAKPVKEA